MRKIIFLFILLYSNNFFSQISHAFVLEDDSGNQIENESTLQFSTYDYPDASYNFYVRNLTSEQINVKAEVTAISGTDGSAMEFCFGECYYGVEINQIYPLFGFVSIEPGETQISTGDHFYNFEGGDGVNPMEYSFRFFMVDENGDELMSIPELLTEYNVNYYYSSTLSLIDNDSSEIKINYNNNQLNIFSPRACNLKIFDLEGKLINNLNLNSGVNLFEETSLDKKILIFRFNFSNGDFFYKKFIFN